jgi:8-oxo-dGTP pyrophosphatase MutT (NUDIX family)
MKNTLSEPTQSDYAPAVEAPDSSNVFALAKARLALDLVETLFDAQGWPSQGDHRLNPLTVPKWAGSQARAAAVLIGLVAHADDVSVILTKRASALKVHSGQIAFPGGKIEPTDKDPLAAALREASEEIGLEADHVEPIGYLEPYLTRTGFLVHPVVAKIIPPFALRINPDEVEDAFEVPLSFLMNAEHHQLQTREENGVPRRFYAMPYGERLIWGITAGILRNLYERLYL